MIWASTEQEGKQNTNCASSTQFREQLEPSAVLKGCAVICHGLIAILEGLLSQDELSGLKNECINSRLPFALSNCSRQIYNIYEPIGDWRLFYFP